MYRSSHNAVERHNTDKGVDLKKDSTVTVTTNQVTNKKITFATTQGASAAIDTSLKTNTTFQSGLITTDRQRVELQKSLTSQIKESANETENFGNKSASALDVMQGKFEGIKNTANEFQGVLQAIVGLAVTGAIGNRRSRICSTKRWSWWAIVGFSEHVHNRCLSAHRSSRIRYRHCQDATCD